jgi:predicted HicB family RNase H-like nuclease
MSSKNDRYTYRVTWSEADREYAGLCTEFPSLSWLAKSPEAALRGIRRLVDEVVSDLVNNKETPPTPISARCFSGRFIVRIPPEVHRDLAMKAAEQGISLNRLISSKLSRI